MTVSELIKMLANFCEGEIGSTKVYLYDRKTGNKYSPSYVGKVEDEEKIDADGNKILTFEIDFCSR